MNTKDNKAKFDREIAKNKSLHECYIRGITAQGTIHTKYKRGDKKEEESPIQLSIVSPLGQPGLVEKDGPYNYKLADLSPFWACLLVSRKAKSNPNMMAYCEKFACQEPRLPGKDLCLAGFECKLTVDVPVLRNIRALKKGDLLFLPYDAGGSSFILKDDVAMHTEHWPPAQ